MDERGDPLILLRDDLMGVLRWATAPPCLSLLSSFFETSSLVGLPPEKADKRDKAAATRFGRL